MHSALAMLPLLAIMFVGAVLTATSVSISAEVLRELRRLRSKLGMTILGAGVGMAARGEVMIAAGQAAREAEPAATSVVAETLMTIGS